MTLIEIHSFVASIAVTLLLILLFEFSSCLRNVSVTVPAAVKRGDNALLICDYDIENDTLYSVKWYRGRREFYRYTPKEKPAWKIFPTTNPGINIDTLQSNASRVVLVKAPLTISGRYACEVSADAPSFHTLISFAEMDVVELPVQRPTITGIHSRYRLGDVINGNCSSDYSKPAANLTWWINDIQVPPNYLRNFITIKHENEQLESAVLEINFIVTLQHFIKSRLKLKCSARIYRIYYGDIEKLLEEDRPRILASGRSPDMYPFDQHNDEFDNDDNDDDILYLNRYNEYSSSSSSKAKDILNSLIVISFIFNYCHLMLFQKYFISNRNVNSSSIKTNRKILKSNRIDCLSRAAASSSSSSPSSLLNHMKHLHHRKKYHENLALYYKLSYAEKYATKCINATCKHSVR